MFLAGTYELTIDAKNRLSIPFAIRRKLHPEEHGQSFYLIPGRRSGTLALYPEKYYERLQENVPPDDALSEEVFAFRQFEYAASALLEPDDQGRVLLPQRLLQRLGFGKDVVLIAVRDHLELWRREDFEAFESGMWAAYAERRAKALEEMKRVVAEHRAAAAGTTP